MKTKNLGKKLNLNKKTVADLGNEAITHVYGGIIQPYSDFSYCNQGPCENCTSMVPIETCGGPSVCDVCKTD